MGVICPPAPIGIWVNIYENLGDTVVSPVFPVGTPLQCIQDMKLGCPSNIVFMRIKKNFVVTCHTKPKGAGAIF